MKVAIIPVTYNSNNALHKYIQSLEQAYLFCPSIEIYLFIADNGSDRFQLDKNRDYPFNITLFKYKNVGYLGAVQRILNEIPIGEFKYVLITNVDVEVKQNFFINLTALSLPGNVGWICPQIWSETERRDRNPFIINRNSKTKLIFLRLMYKYPILHKIYSKTLYKRKRLCNIVTRKDTMPLYAGHGSFIILTDTFFNKINERLDYPIFLYGEECYIAELCCKYSLRVVYTPTLQVVTTDHVSTGKMKSKLYYECNYSAISYLINKFY